MEKQREPDEKLRFKPVAGLKLVYEPGIAIRKPAKKHPCPDCHFCQQCGDARCHSCRGKKSGPNGCSTRKLSLREQIRLYDEINARTQ